MIENLALLLSFWGPTGTLAHAEMPTSRVTPSVAVTSVVTPSINSSSHVATPCLFTLQLTARSEQDESNKIVYVLDLSSLLSDPHILDNLGASQLVIPMSVLEELETLLRGPDPDLSGRAKSIASDLRERMSKAKATVDIPLERGGSLTFVGEPADVLQPLQNLVGVAEKLQALNPNARIVVLSERTDFVVYAQARGLQAQENPAVEEARALEVNHGNLTEGLVPYSQSEVDALFADPLVSLDLLSEGINPTILPENAYVIYRGLDFIPENDIFDLQKSASQTRRFSHGENSFSPIRLEQINDLFIQPRNHEQMMAFDLLLDPSISLIALTGPAGSGKTLVALAAAIAQSSMVKDEPEFDSIIYARSPEVTGKSLGFLPGNIDSKTEPLMKPLYDSLTLLVSEARQKQFDESEENPAPAINPLECLTAAVVPEPEKLDEKAVARAAHKQKAEKKKAAKERLNDPKSILRLKGRPDQVGIEMVKRNFIQTKVPTFVRGQTWNRTFLIIDEAQNLSAHEIKTMITRAGEGTKVVLLGDPGQIDALNLTAYNNGLSVVIRSFLNRPEFGFVHLQQGERSNLATTAASLLK